MWCLYLGLAGLCFIVSGELLQKLDLPNFFLTICIGIFNLATAIKEK